MLMEGRVPDDWEKREWGSMKDFSDAAKKTLTCADKDGNNPPWWEGTACESHTGETCRVKCKGGAKCLSGKCVCGMGPNHISMCAVNGECVERDDTCMYMGEPCYRIAADNPSAPW